MNIRIQTSQIQKQVLSSVMQQSIEVLLLPVYELEAAIEQELQDNPLLEIANTTQDHEITSIDKTVDLHLQNIKNNNSQDTSQLDTDSTFTENEPYTPPICREIALEEHLLQQLRLEFSAALDIQIGEYLIGNINRNGYLDVTIAEAAAHLKINNSLHIENILKRIQQFDPPGIGARDLKECLIAQIDARFSESDARLSRIIIKNHLDLLSRKQFSQIARELKVSLEDARHIAQSISKLDPKPATRFRKFDTNIYVKPDITTFKDESNTYHIHLNNDNLPSLKISQSYQRLLKSQTCSSEEMEYIRGKVKDALFFIRSINQRHETLRLIATCIVKKQKAFLENGPLEFQPMTLKDVATEISRNESTVSRAVNNKYIDTPQGLLPLKFFFSKGLEQQQTTAQQAVSNKMIMEKIRLLIEDENKTAPLSDQDIQDQFRRENLNVARRTISKYRQALKIEPSHLRRQR